jgi:hypothetical protein
MLIQNKVKFNQVYKIHLQAYRVLDAYHPSKCLKD